MTVDVSGVITTIGNTKVLIIAVIFVLLFIAERVAAAASPPIGRERLVRNFGLMFVILLLSPLIITPITAFGANHLLWTRPDWMMTGALAVVVITIDIVLLDLWTYWVHRLYHRVPLFWRLHSVHHLDEFLDSTSAFRFHVGEVILSAFLRLIMIVILAPSLATVIFYETLLVSTALFHHSNLRMPPKLERGLALLIVTPSIHWVHHHATVPDTNSNFAAVFSLWDRLFTSKSDTMRDRNMKIGLESIEDKPFFRLILMPFQRKER
ncbi:sterol desaturase family protein [Hyphococcus lacteus]|uniref:Sterol desaturase family protein n=1 Tax=Hyphococcus lacteus TaxID=3143536 RepID=A0ABV3Z5D4_9PROT